MDILLDTFKTGEFCYLFWAKGTNAHFDRHEFIHLLTSGVESLSKKRKRFIYFWV